MRPFAPPWTVRNCRHRVIGVRLLGIFLAFAVAQTADATVRRRLNVNSNPPGALVYVDNQQIGTTPCSVDFTYYGTREIRLIKPGFETLTVNQPIPAPWYQYVPLDFISENLVATKIRDNRTVTYNLAPQLIIPPQELVARANQLRQDTRQLPVPPPAANLPPGAMPSATVAPPITVPEPLPGLGPPPTGQPIGPQPILAPPPGPPPVTPRSPLR